MLGGLLLALLALLAVPAERVGATCECPPPPATRDAAADSNAVFLGTVTAIRPPQPELTFDRTPPFVHYDVPYYAPIAVDLDVQQVWVGPAYTTQRLTTARSYTTCGVPFVVGRSYLVYAYERYDGALQTHRCSRSREASAAADDLATLGSGRPPALARPTDSRGELALAFLCLLALLTLGGGWLWYRSRRLAGIRVAD